MNKVEKKAKVDTKNEKETPNVIKKKFDGFVVSDKMNKTIVVKVDSTKIHPKYKKRYTLKVRKNILRMMKRMRPKLAIRLSL